MCFFLRVFGGNYCSTTSLEDYLLGCLLLSIGLLFMYALKRIFSKPISLHKFYANMDQVEILPKSVIATKATKVSLKTKTILFGMSLCIIITPLYELIETLRPETCFYYAFF